jgi:hypothetical protein
MPPPDRASIDRRAAEAAEDLRELAGLWISGGAGALDAAVRSHPAWTFAVRRLPAAVELIAMRACAPPGVITMDPLTPGAPVYSSRASGGEVRIIPEIVFTFGQSAAGERAVLARADLDLMLVADPAFETVTVAPSDRMLAEEMAWRFDVGVSATAAPPAWLGRSAEHTAVLDDAGLLRVLDAAARMLDGRLDFVAGMWAIAAERRQWGLPEDDPDMRTAYVIDTDTVDPSIFFWRKEEKGGQWSWDDHMADRNDRARAPGTKACRSLIDRFRGDAFARG